jgi:hypothetical protein
VSTHSSELSLKIACACGCGGIVTDWEDFLRDFADHRTISFLADFRGAECGPRRVAVDRLIKRMRRAFGVRDDRGIVGVSSPKNSMDQ